MQEKRVRFVMFGLPLLISLFALAVSVVVFSVTKLFRVSVEWWWWTAFASACIVGFTLGFVNLLRQLIQIQTSAHYNHVARAAWILCVFFCIIGVAELLLTISMSPYTHSMASYYALSGGFMGLGIGLGVLMAWARYLRGRSWQFPCEVE